MQATLSGHSSSVVIANWALANSSRGNQDYFNCRPTSRNDRTPTPKRLHVPDPLRIQADHRTPLSAGPAGYKYTPSCSRTPHLESFRHDHGIRFKRRTSIRAVILCCDWYLLFDEDAWPSRMSERCVDFAKSVNGSLKRLVADCTRAMSRVLMVSQDDITDDRSDLYVRIPNATCRSYS